MTMNARMLRRPVEQDDERDVLCVHADRIAKAIGRGCFLAEVVGGSGENGEVLLAHLLAPAAYVIVDADRARLARVADEIEERHPQIDVLPVPLELTPELSLPRC